MKSQTRNAKTFLICADIQSTYKLTVITRSLVYLFGFPPTLSWYHIYTIYIYILLSIRRDKRKAPSVRSRLFTESVANITL